jgi:metallo-beta-lactamase class B
MRCTKLIAAAAVSAFFMLAPLQLSAQQTFKQLPITVEAYVKPFPPLRIVGNLYYVGTYDLAVYLITTPEGHILINTGVNDSVAPIRANIEALGFKFTDIKLLLGTHGHWDHVAGMAEIKRITGAQMMMHEEDTPLVESGGSMDYRFPQGRGPVFEPVKVDRQLKEGDKVKLGDVELTVIHHPGHTKGSTSFTYTAKDDGRDYPVLIVNMGSINPGVMVTGMPAFPNITDAYATTLKRQKELRPQVWVSSHAGHFNLHQKYKPGDKYDPNRFVDTDGFLAKIQFYEKLYNAQLQREREAKSKSN